MVRAFHILENKKVVAEGVCFSDGRVATRWISGASAIFFNTIESLEKTYCNETTEIKFISINSVSDENGYTVKPLPFTYGILTKGYWNNLVDLLKQAIKGEKFLW